MSADTSESVTTNCGADSPKVSVIVPVFNGENTLSRAARSVLDQTYNNVELILVNDGSEDNSLDVMTELAAFDDRVKVLDQPNKGVSAARNRGLEEASGDFVAFLDADDWLERIAMSTLVDIATEHDAECVRYNNFVHRGARVIKRETPYQGRVRLDSKGAIERYIEWLLVGTDTGYVWALFISSEIARSARFDERIRIYEDLLYSIDVLKMTGSVVLTDEPFLHYDVTGDSATRNASQMTRILRNALGGETVVMEALRQMYPDGSETGQRVTRARLTLISDYVAWGAARGRLDTEEIARLLSSFRNSGSVQEAFFVAYPAGDPPPPLGVQLIERKDWGPSIVSYALKVRGYGQAIGRIVRRVTKKGVQAVTRGVTTRQDISMRHPRDEKREVVHPSGRPDVWVQTMPIVAKSYGCLLQATAMQRVLLDLGFTPITNAFSLPRRSWRTYARYCLSILKGRSFKSVRTWTLETAPYASLDAFARSHLSLTNRVYGIRGGPVPKRFQQIPVAVVGSDQVWRPEYVNVLWGVFAYMSPRNPKRVSYAASFGLDNASEFPAAVNEEFGRNLREFKAVSVRESSGVDLCASEWAVEATQVLDPTMLLTGEEWTAYMGEARRASDHSGDLVYIVLDTSPELEEQALALAERVGLKLRVLLPPRAESYVDYRRDPSRYEMPPVEEWLSAIFSAGMVLTDSFHASVFSILFETPFYTVRNEERGATRFDSLGIAAGVPAQFVASDMLKDVVSIPEIDWGEVRRSLDERRQDSMEFLMKAVARE